MPRWLFWLPLAGAARLVLADSAPLTRKDQHKTVALLLVQGKTGCDEFQYWIRYFANTSSSIRLVDVVVLDDVATQCITEFISAYPGFVRQMQKLYGPEAVALTRAASIPVSFKKRGRGRRLWPSNAYQLMIWIAIRQRLEAGEHILHMDTDAIPLIDLFPRVVLDHADADIVAARDCFGPGCKELGGSLNPGVMFMRSSSAALSVINSIIQKWETEFFDNSTGTVKPIQSKNHEICDMFQLNYQLIARGCTRARCSRHRVCLRCHSNDDGVDLNAQYLNEADGFFRGCDQKCSGAKKGLVERCLARKVAVCHSHGPSFSELQKEAPPLPSAGLTTVAASPTASSIPSASAGAAQPAVAASPPAISAAAAPALLPPAAEEGGGREETAASSSRQASGSPPPAASLRSSALPAAPLQVTAAAAAAAQPAAAAAPSHSQGDLTSSHQEAGAATEAAPHPPGPPADLAADVPDLARAVAAAVLGLCLIFGVGGRMWCGKAASPTEVALPRHLGVEADDEQEELQELVSSQPGADLVRDGALRDGRRMHDDAHDDL